MTDDRQPDQPQAAGAEPAPPTPPIQPDQQPPPPPLAPLVDDARAGATDPLDETATQPTAGWTSPGAYPAPPPIPPPAVQPGVSWAAAPPAQVPVAGQRTPLAVGAGILLVVGGILGGLAALGTLAFGRFIVDAIEDLGPFPGLEGADAHDILQGAIVFVGGFILICSIVYVIAGIGVLRSRDWGRVLGIIIGILGGLFWLPALSSAGVAGVRENLAGPLIMLAAHAYIAIALIVAWRTRVPGR